MDSYMSLYLLFEFFLYIEKWTFFTKKNGIQQIIVNRLLRDTVQIVRITGRPFSTIIATYRGRLLFGKKYNL